MRLPQTDFFFKYSVGSFWRESSQRRENLSWWIFCLHRQNIIFPTFHHDKCVLTIMLTDCSVGGIPFCVSCVVITDQSIHQQTDFRVLQRACTQHSFFFYSCDYLTEWFIFFLSHNQCCKTLSLQAWVCETLPASNRETFSLGNRGISALGAQTCEELTYFSAVRKNAIW